MTELVLSHFSLPRLHPIEDRVRRELGLMKGEEVAAV